MISSLTITSYNCRGAMFSYAYLDALLNTCDITCIQEHHLIPETSNFLKTIHPDFTGKVKVNNINNNMDGIRSERGGIAILWRKTINHTVTEIQCNNSDRLMGVTLTVPGKSPIHIFNIYLPSTNTSMTDYCDVMDNVQTVYNEYSMQGTVVMVGDLNAQLGPRWFSSVSSRTDSPRLYCGQLAVSISV